MGEETEREREHTQPMLVSSQWAHTHTLVLVSGWVDVWVALRVFRSLKEKKITSGSVGSFAAKKFANFQEKKKETMAVFACGQVLLVVSKT